MLPEGVTLVAVSKTHAADRILEAYHAGQRVFGENRVQELVPKYEELPKDIEWHLIGHLQSNKVKYIAPFVSLIHSVDSEKLLAEINKQAGKCGRKIDVLLQVFVAREETKFGFYPEELTTFFASENLRDYPHVRIRGLMAMATNTDEKSQVAAEFSQVAALFETVRTHAGTDFNILSMGMSSDWQTAVQQGSNMVRIGSTIFGNR